MKKFITEILLILVPFLLIILGTYVYTDPFCLSNSYPLGEDTIGKYSCVNVAYQGIKVMDYYQDSIKYDSFILGSSRSEFYMIEDWKKYIGSATHPIHFSQSGDGLLGTLLRTRYLYERFHIIKHLLIVIDRYWLGDVSIPNGHLFSMPWQVTGWQDYIAFHWDFIKAFYSIDYWQSKSISEQQFSKTYIPYYNENHKEYIENLIDSDTLQYQMSHWGRGSLDFYERPTEEQQLEPIIGKQQYELLLELRELLKNDGTDYRIVISPLYDQLKINDSDYQILCNLFGSDYVYDFSGKNDLTNPISNYYESSHYRSRVCGEIMRRIYVSPQDSLY